MRSSEQDRDAAGLDARPDALEKEVYQLPEEQCANLIDKAIVAVSFVNSYGI
jgi:hypothetical protein